MVVLFDKNDISLLCSQFYSFPNGSFIVKAGKEYSDDVANDFNYINNHSETMSKSEWEKYYKKYKNDLNSPVIQLFLKRKPPENILIDIAKSFIEAYKGPRNPGLNEYQTLNYCLLHDIYPNDILKKLFDTARKASTPYFLEFMYRNGDKIPEKNLEFFANFYLSNPYFRKNISVSDEFKHVLLNIRSDIFARGILYSGNCTENIRNELINNKNLLPELKTEIYNQGVDLLQINYKDTTSDIIEDAYKCAVSAITDFDVNIVNYEEKMPLLSKEERNNFETAERVICRIVSSKNLKESLQDDLYERIKNLNPTKECEILQTLLSNATSPRIFFDIENIKSCADKKSALLSPNIPEEILIKKFKSIAEDAQKRYKKTLSFRIKESDYELMCHIITSDNISFPDDVYNAVLIQSSLNQSSINGSSIIASSLRVPDNILNHMTSTILGNKSYVYEYVCSKLNLLLRNNEIVKGSEIGLKKYLNRLCLLKCAPSTDSADIAKRVGNTMNLFVFKNVYEQKNEAIITNEINVVNEIYNAIDDLEKSECDNIRKYPDISSAILAVKQYILGAKTILNAELSRDFSNCWCDWNENSLYGAKYYFSAKCFDIVSFYENIQNCCNAVQQIYDSTHKINKDEVKDDVSNER